jgi:tRNA(Ile)-lysidine synthase TilS/MesJ
MVCKICSIKPVWKFTNQQQICEKCFVQYFEKKVKCTIRKYQMPIEAVNGNSLKSKIIYNIIKDLPIRKGKLIEDNLDNISLGILTELINGKSKNFNKFIPRNQPLYFLSSKEIELYAKITGIKGKTEKINKKQEKINDFIKKIEEKNQDIRQNIVNSLIKIK